MVLPGYIIEAAWHNDLDTIRDWLDNGGDINDTEDGTGVTIVNIGAVNEEFESCETNDILSFVSSTVIGGHIGEVCYYQTICCSRSFCESEPACLQSSHVSFST